MFSLSVAFIILKTFLQPFSHMNGKGVTNNAKNYYEYTQYENMLHCWLLIIIELCSALSPSINLIYILLD